MTRALLKKQMLELFSLFYRDSKTGKNRNKKSIVIFALLYLCLFGYLGFIFWTLADSLCVPLKSAGFEWLYMALMSLIALALGVFGSVFNTYASIYQAKDNDLLLSMPIPASKILFIRLTGVYVTGLMYELIVMVPTVIVFFLNVKLGIWGYVFSFLIPFILAVIALALSCVLGFFVALISSVIKNRKFVTVALSLGFIFGYYYVYMRAYELMQFILADPSVLGNKIKGILYPFYRLGLAAEGDLLSMVIFTGIAAALFVAVYFVLSRSFLRIATTNKGVSRVKYKEKAVKSGNVKSALFKKELRRFTGSSTYMLNCGLGIVFMVAAAVAVIVKADLINEILQAVFKENKDVISLLAAAAICMLTTMNDITSPSISLEGNNIWILQSLPVNSSDVLTAKLKLHFYLTATPALICASALLWVIRPRWYFMLLIPAATVGFIVFMALTGLWLNLKFHNLKWTNETVPVKQSMSVFMALFGGWSVVLGFGGIYLAAMKYIEPVFYLIFVIALLVILSAILFRWIKVKGTKIFETL